MGWLRNRATKLMADKQRSEIEAFISNLKSADSSEIGMLVAGATHIRHGLERQGHIISDPINYAAAHPLFAAVLSRGIKNLQKSGQLDSAAAMMVWLHTFRAATWIELRGHGREVWRELPRGFPEVERVARDMDLFLNIDPEIEGYDEFPTGFTPDPL